MFLGGRLFTSTTEVQRVTLEEIDLSREVVGKNPSFVQRQSSSFFVGEYFIFIYTFFVWGCYQGTFHVFFQNLLVQSIYSKTKIPQGSSLKTAWPPLPGIFPPRIIVQVVVVKLGF